MIFFNCIKKIIINSVIRMESNGQLSPSHPTFILTNNRPRANHPDFVLQRSISILSATTTDGFTVYANKHYNYAIENGTLSDAVRNGYINSREAMYAKKKRQSRSLERL